MSKRKRSDDGKEIPDAKRQKIGGTEAPTESIEDVIAFLNSELMQVDEQPVEAKYTLVTEELLRIIFVKKCSIEEALNLSVQEIEAIKSTPDFNITHEEFLASIRESKEQRENYEHLWFGAILFSDVRLLDKLNVDSNLLSDSTIQLLKPYSELVANYRQINDAIIIYDVMQKFVKRAPPQFQEKFEKVYTFVSIIIFNTNEFHTQSKLNNITNEFSPVSKYTKFRNLIDQFLSNKPTIQTNSFDELLNKVPFLVMILLEAIYKKYGNFAFFTMLDHNSFQNAVIELQSDENFARDRPKPCYAFSNEFVQELCKNFIAVITQNNFIQFNVEQILYIAKELGNDDAAVQFAQSKLQQCKQISPYKFLTNDAVSLKFYLKFANNLFIKKILLESQLENIEFLVLQNLIDNRIDYSEQDVNEIIELLLNHVNNMNPQSKAFLFVLTSSYDIFDKTRLADANYIDFTNVPPKYFNQLTEFFTHYPNPSLLNHVAKGMPLLSLYDVCKNDAGEPDLKNLPLKRKIHLLLNYLTNNQTDNNINLNNLLSDLPISKLVGQLIPLLKGLEGASLAFNKIMQLDLTCNIMILTSLLAELCNHRMATPEQFRFWLSRLCNNPEVLFKLYDLKALNKFEYQIMWNDIKNVVAYLRYFNSRDVLDLLVSLMLKNNLSQLQALLDLHKSKLEEYEMLVSKKESLQEINKKVFHCLPSKYFLMALYSNIKNSNNHEAIEIFNQIMNCYKEMSKLSKNQFILGILVCFPHLSDAKELSAGIQTNYFIDRIKKKFTKLAEKLDSNQINLKDAINAFDEEFASLYSLPNFAIIFACKDIVKLGETRADLFKGIQDLLVAHAERKKYTGLVCKNFRLSLEKIVCTPEIADKIMKMAGI